MPKKIAERIIQLQRRFFWGRTMGEKGGNLISWDVIQKPKEQGGLGVGDIHLKNASLLFKWWWRWADNQKLLWKEIIGSIHRTKYIGDPQMVNEKAQTSIWGQIANFKSFSKEIQEVARTGIQMKVGNGAQTRFWYDKWTGEESLKTIFPRLFMLSTQKNKLIEEMGVWENENWRWVYKWRRNLFAWEEDLAGDLFLAVNRVVLRENKSDERVWSVNKSNVFSSSNFVLQVTRRLDNTSTTSKQGCLAWKNVAPPRAILHVWFVLQGRLNTKVRLRRFGTPGIEDDKCVLCKKSRRPWSISFLPAKSPVAFGITAVRGGISHFACPKNQWHASSLG